MPDQPTHRMTCQLAKNDLGRMVFRFQMASIKKPGLLATGDIDPKGEDGVYSPRDVQRRIAVTGGALAEYLIENYDDEVEPSEAAKGALEAFHCFCTRAKEAGLNLPLL